MKLTSSCYNTDCLTGATCYKYTENGFVQHFNYCISVCSRSDQSGCNLLIRPLKVYTVPTVTV